MLVVPVQIEGVVGSGFCGFNSSNPIAVDHKHRRFEGWLRTRTCHILTITGRPQARQLNSHSPNVNVVVVLWPGPSTFKSRKWCARRKLIAVRAEHTSGKRAR